MPNHQVDVIDFGLTAPQAVEIGLETELFTRKKALPADLDLDEVALEWFTGIHMRGNQYECTRCELNAFSADQLAEFIKAGLESAGAIGKLATSRGPADRACADGTRRIAHLAGRTEAGRANQYRRGGPPIAHEKPDLVEVTEADVRARFDNHPTESWRAAADRLVNDDIDRAELVDRITELLTEQIDQAR